MIVKDDVGKSKPSTRDLPAFGFMYGKPDRTSGEGAREVTTFWKTHISNAQDDSNNPRNFKNLNKHAVIEGRVTAKENRAYRMDHDSRIPFGMSALKNSKRGISLPQETFCYGKPSRPQTPLGGIISNTFGETASQILQSRYNNIKEYKQVNSPKKVMPVRYTQAQMKADEFVKTKNAWNKSETREDFKLKRFKNVDSKIDNKR